MNKRTLSLVVVAIIALVIAIIIIDFAGSKPDKRGENPWEYNVDEYREVDESLVHYREISNIPLGGFKASTMDVRGEDIYLAAENSFQMITTSGIRKMKVETEGIPEAIKVNDKFIALAFEKSVAVFDHSGNTLAEWTIPSEKSVLTSLALKDTLVYLADAGNRRVMRYTVSGTYLGEFEGKRDSRAGHGFIVPSANFDLVINTWGELWVVNPGQHSIENYTGEGQIRGYWTKSSMKTEGFTGCCNPAEIAVMEDGSFITSEKGLVRIKIYDPSGKLLSVVAPPSLFMEEGHAPEVAEGSRGLIYALDFDRNTVRIFEKKQETTNE